jgi:hypothetical protein
MTAPEEEFTPDEHLAPDERDPRSPPVEIHRGLEVDEYDAIEQGQAVNTEDDEY